MPTPLYKPKNRAPLSGRYLSLPQLKRYDMPQGMFDLMAPFMISDTIYFKDDFLGDTINLDNYVVGESTAACTVFAMGTTVGNGVITGATTATAGDSIFLVMPTTLIGQQNPYIETRLKIGATTAGINVEFGLGDAASVASTSAPAITDIDGATFAGTDAAMLAIDTTQTIATWAAASIGSGTSQGTVVTAIATSTFTLVADTYVRLGVELVTQLNATGDSSTITFAYFYINGVRVATHAPVAGAIKGDVLLAPWLYVRTRAAAVKTCSVDYIYYIADRL